MFDSPQPVGGATFQPPMPESETSPIVAPPTDTPAEGVEEIHTMPGKFRASPKPEGKGKGNRPLIITMIALGVILLGGGVVLALRMTGNLPFGASQENTNLVTNVNHAVNSNANTNSAANLNSDANANVNAAAPTIVHERLVDPETNEELGAVTLTIPAGALPSTVTTVAITTLSPSIGAYATSTAYTAVGGVYIMTPTKTALSKNATVVMTYTDSELLGLDFVVDEGSLTAASWDGTEWKPINSLVDESKNTVTAEISEFLSDGIAIVIGKPASTNTNVSLNTNSGVTTSLDSDADSLTNQEEILYGTNAGSPDTDLDGFTDGQEVLAQYNPNGAGRLADTALVKKTENTTYRYSILSPPSWTVGSLNAEKLITLTSATGVFVQVSVQENTSKLSAREWYLSLNPSVDQASLKDIAVSNLTGVLGPDRLNVYLADTQYIYQVTYNIGIKNEANYFTTFTMMYGSFQTGITPSSTNTNANANTNSAANANGNANTTGSVSTEGS